MPYAPLPCPSWLRHAGLPLLLTAGLLAAAHAAEPPAPAGSGQRIENAQDKAALAERISEAIARAQAKHPKKGARPAPPPTLTITVPQQPKAPPRPAATPRPRPVPPSGATPAPAPLSAALADPGASRRYIETRAEELAAQTRSAETAARPEPDPRTVPWTYEGATGPQAWGQLHSGFATCGTGQQQSPIHTTGADTVAGPAEALQPGAQTFGGTLVHTGRHLRLDVNAAPALVLRGQSWRLTAVEFHHPAEEQVHFRRFPMATDLLYQSPAGDKAVVSVPMRLGQAHPWIAKVWAFMPLAAQDRVSLPARLLSVEDLLPLDRRYYQYLGSLTTPPCTEGVVRIVLKTPVEVSPEQLRLLTRLTPANARPPQPLNGRVVREAQ
ncbi:MAG: carbonic anhydrase family protein [Burkholderiaceae bacterium]|nr:carbonic anhydrase family protein [Burkholderiaceae bacterium]